MGYPGGTARGWLSLLAGWGVTAEPLSTVGLGAARQGDTGCPGDPAVFRMAGEV